MSKAKAEQEDSETHFWDGLPKPLSGFSSVLVGLGLTALMTFACLGIAAWLPAQGIAMLYILVVVGGAVAFGMTNGMSVAVFSFLAYNFFFLKPVYTFTISDPRDLLALLVYFGVAAAAGSLAGRLREVADRANVRSRSLRSLNTLAAQLSGGLNFDAVAQALASGAAKAASGESVVMKWTGDELVICAQTRDVSELSTADWQAANRSVASRETIYPAEAGWGESKYEFRPVISRGAAVAVLGVRANTPGDDECDTTLRAMVDHAEIALERINLETEKAKVLKEAEIERLRSALLSSVSHDIKTPLASIQGAVTSLRHLGSQMADDTKDDLLLAIEEEAKRLSRFVTNLLDMSRIEAGSLDLRRDWMDLGDAVSTSVARARQLLPSAQIVTKMRDTPSIIRGKETVIEHVILNVIENAVNFSPSGEPVTVALAREANSYSIVVEDHGSGISATDLPRIFEKFYRGSSAKTGGSGLGLTICKQIVESLGGTIAVQSPHADGASTRVTLVLPIDDENGDTSGDAT